jgi:hypothetical protein
VTALHALRITLLAVLLSGCSSHLLEDVVEVGQLSAPRPCSEPTKLFGTFTMRATKMSWKGDSADANPMLTLELSVANDKNFPLALSNSGNGVLYTVAITLQAEKGGSFVPKEASGIVLMREPKQFKEPRRPGPFGFQTPPKKPENPKDNTRDLNFRIQPGEPEPGKLVFQAPRANYLLVMERKFANKPASGQPTDRVTVCKISSSDTAALTPRAAPATPGVY